MQTEATLPERMQSTNSHGAQGSYTSTMCQRASTGEDLSWASLPPCLPVSGCSRLSHGFPACQLHLRLQGDERTNAGNTNTQELAASLQLRKPLNLVSAPETLFRGFTSPPDGKLPWVSTWKEECVLLKASICCVNQQKHTVWWWF